jgi:hypothetical protein
VATLLIDGFVGGTWRIERKGKRAELRVTLFAEVSGEQRAEIEREAEGLLGFLAGDAVSREFVLTVGD